jgi:hypothetical protein
MLKFLYTATKVAGLTYQLMATSAYIGLLAYTAYKAVKKAG